MINAITSNDHRKSATTTKCFAAHHNPSDSYLTCGLNRQVKHFTSGISIESSYLHRKYRCSVNEVRSQRTVTAELIHANCPGTMKFTFRNFPTAVLKDPQPSVPVV